MKPPTTPARRRSKGKRHWSEKSVGRRILLAERNVQRFIKRLNDWCPRDKEDSPRP